MLACSCSPSFYCFLSLRGRRVAVELNYGSFKLPPLGKLHNPTVVRWRKGGYRLKSTAESGASSSIASLVELDSQNFYPTDFSQLLWVGPLPGDLAEVEAFCRIFRAAEQLHSAIMEILCNPETGECAVSYKTASSELPLLEENVAVALGCIAALLNRAREDVLAGRSAAMVSFQASDVNVLDGKVPPLAMFRGEMKRCTKNLQGALELYFSAFENQRSYIWRRLQRLKNVCYDAGFPRADDSPSQALFANWTPVHLSTRKDDIDIEESEVSFWKGGQVTDEGLKWLIDKGFKTIVDLRAENVLDDDYQDSLQLAVSCGKIRLVKFPVEVGKAPSMDQVEEFASLVSDSSSRPLYVHSQEGVWRTAAMVSRWRQYTTRSTSSFHSLTTSSSTYADTTETSNGHSRNVFSKEGLGNTMESENGSVEKHADTILVPTESLHEQGPSILDYQGESEAVNGYNGKPANDAGATISVESDEKYHWEVDPFKTQVPTCNIFSKREMSNFIKSQKISPRSFLDLQKSRVDWSSARTSRARRKSQSQLKHANPEASNGAVGDINLSSGLDGVYNSIEKAPPNSFSAFSEGNGHANSGQTTSIVTDDPRKDIASVASKDRTENSSVALPSKIDGLEVNGNMCASTTGVVRIQSRKKAEMFLVRTDGFSCTREKVTESSLAFTHPSTQQQMLMWKSSPKTVLLLKKLGDELMEEAKQVATFLHYQEKMNVLVEPDLHDVFARIPGFGFVQTFYIQDTSDLHERVDFVACLGGDGVILHASNLFRDAVPPVVSFNLGSLGFLTSHTFEDYKRDLRAVIHGNHTMEGVYITLRMRLRCEIFRNGKALPGKIFDVLNEVVVDRGSNPYLSKIECYEHDRLITKVQGDGVIIATPTGSTAYSTAAGGSMVHPNVPCMLFTPICPHSLSFRPVILPDSARLELKIPEDARSNAWVSFDGKRRQQLSRGDSVKIFMSEHPLPTVNKCDQTGDWFRSLIRCLNWNERLDQKAL
ncbi:probable NAD kinase 2, chloroplastic [Nymphaea colorata]|nr:probable NAD kinase 2, chloroplastic [Nymphaea colorata]